MCSTTLWVGHLSKLVHQEELSDTFGKYGDIVSIDMIHPRGCAFIVMNRRQDAYKAMGGLKSYKLQGRAITISWAAGKGVKSKEWKDYWDLELGVSYVPWNKLDVSTDFESLEEGGMFDEDSMPGWLKEKIKNANTKKEPQIPTMFPNQMPGGTGVDITQPPPNGPQQMMQNVSMVPPFAMGPVPRLMPPMGMHMPPMPGIMPLGVPPPQMMMQPPQRLVPGLPPMPLDKSVPPPMGHFPPMPGAMPPHPQMPPLIPPAPSMSSTSIGAGGASGGDDHMDIDMDDEPSTKIQNNMINSMAPMGMFNRPPPQMFSGGQSMPGPPGMPHNDARDESRERSRRNRSSSRDRPSRERERGSDGDFRSGGGGDSRDRGRDRDRNSRNRDRDSRGGGNDRGNDNRRNDYTNRDRDSRNSNSRWGGGDRGRSRDDEIGHRERRNNSRDRGDRVSSRDRNDRSDKPLQDRLRDMAGSDGGDFNSRRSDNNNDMPNWREVPPQQVSGNYPPPGNFMDPTVRGIRPLSLLSMGAPPLMDTTRGPPNGPNFRGGNDFGILFFYKFAIQI